MKRGAGVLLLPEVGEERRQPDPRQPGQLVDADVAARAECDQLGGFLAAGAPVVDMGADRDRVAGGTVVAIAVEDGQAQAAEATAGVGELLAAAGAERGSGGCRGAAGAEEGFLQGEWHDCLLTYYNVDL